MTAEITQWHETQINHEAFTYFFELITNSPDKVAVIDTPTRRHVICTFNYYSETEDRKNLHIPPLNLKVSSVCVLICPLGTDPKDVTSPSATYPPLETFLLFNQVSDDLTPPLWIISKAPLSIRIPGVGFVKGNIERPDSPNPHHLRVSDRAIAEDVGNTLVSYLETYGVVRSPTLVGSPTPQG